MNKFYNVLAFAIGAAVGSVVTWKLIETKYNKIVEEEIESVKEYYSRKEQDVSEEQQVVSEAIPVKPDLAEYAKMVENEGYTSYSDTKTEDKEEATVVNEPYVIAPEELGEIYGYEVESLKYFADGVLTDDWDDPIDDVESLVGDDFMNHFGDYGEDSVCIRNEDLKKDFEILEDEREYSEVNDGSTSS